MADTVANSFRAGEDFSQSETLLSVSTQHTTANLPDPTTAWQDDVPSSPLLITFEVVLILCIIIGTFGNVLVILAIMRTKKLRVWPNALLVNMALADLGVCDLVIPTMLRRSLAGARPEEVLFWCRSAFYLNIIFCIVSLSTLYCISLNRYILITRPKQVYIKYCTKRGTVAMLCWVWASTVTLTLLPVLGFGSIEYSQPINGCTIREGDALSWWYMTLIIFLGVLSCIVIVPSVYVLIFVKLYRSRKRVQDTIEYSRQCSDGRSIKRTARENYFSKEELAVTRMIVIVCLMFTVCWIPFTLNHLVGWEQLAGPTFAKLTWLCAVAHSVCNPIIYAGINPIFRESFRNILSCKCMTATL